MNTSVITDENNKTPGDVMRFWRKLNRMSQLDLALDIGVSSKHLSFVETGRSQPSRELILKIAHHLKLPYRHRNAFLKVAGYAAEYNEESFDGKKMEIVRYALHHMIDNHEPYPAFVINSSYEILMANKSFTDLVTFLAGGEVLNKYNNSMLLLFAHDGLRKYVKDWNKIEQFLLARLYDEVITTQNSELIALHKEILKLKSKEVPFDFQIEKELPFLTLTLEKDSMDASFFTTITTLGTPLDLATQELRIELLFPADEETRQFFNKKF